MKMLNIVFNMSITGIIMFVILLLLKPITKKHFNSSCLSVVSSSKFKRASLTTSMGSSGKQLKTRLENIIYSFKSTRKRQLMSLAVAILILISGFTVGCSILPDNTSEEDTPINQNNSNTGEDILEQLESKEFFIRGENSSDSDDEVIVEFGKSFVNLFNGAVGKQKKVSFENYISNENLQRFTDKMLELTQKQDIEGSNAVSYGLENKFGQAELQQYSEGELWNLKLPFQYKGSGMAAELLIKSEDKVLKLLDFYFGDKDGVDTFATGHPAVRKIRDPHLWENEEWVEDVFTKLKEFEKMLKTDDSTAENETNKEINDESDTNTQNIDLEKIALEEVKKITAKYGYSLKSENPTDIMIGDSEVFRLIEEASIKSGYSESDLNSMTENRKILEYELNEKSKKDKSVMLNIVVDNGKVIGAYLDYADYNPGITSIDFIDNLK